MRLFLAGVGILGALAAPPWVPLICMLLLTFRYPAWEALFIGFLMDILWLPSDFFHAIPLFTIAALILVWGLEPLRKELLVR